ncbi:MAG: ribosome-associated translation inhibitor RaiA [Candidatus Kerfeldbacteria bacterium]
MPTNISGKNMDLTDAIKSYVMEKTASLTKYYNNIIEIDVEVSRNTHHKKGDVFNTRMNVSVPNQLLRCEQTQEDLYASIDVCRDEMERQVRRYKEKFETKNKKARKHTRNLKSILTFWKEQGD